MGAAVSEACAELLLAGITLKFRLKPHHSCSRIPAKLFYRTWAQYRAIANCHGYYGTGAKNVRKRLTP